MFLNDFLYMHLHIIGGSVRGVRGSMHLLVISINSNLSFHFDDSLQLGNHFTNYRTSIQCTPDSNSVSLSIFFEQKNFWEKNN